MNKNFKHLIICGAAALLAAGVSGCSDYLDVTDETSVSPDNFPTNLEHANLLLNSAYAGSHGYGLYAFYWYPQLMYLLDKTHDLYGDYDSRTLLLANDASTSCSKLRSAYSDIMNWIQYSNAALQGVRSYEANASDSEMKEAKYIEGQALFLRGLAYWHAQIFFELESKEDGLGFPIIEKVPESIDEMAPSRASVKDTWDFTIATFREAAELLKGYSDKTRATEYAAKGMLAKALMQAGRPDEAIPVLEEIFANSGASLLPWDQYSQSFFADEKYEFNKETLYEIDMTSNDKQTGPWAGFTTGSGMPLVMAPWFCTLDIRRFTPPEPGKEFATQSNGGWGNNFLHDESVRRFGYPLEIPPIRVYNEKYDAKKGVTIENYPWILDPEYTERSRKVRENVECDPRLFISGGQPYFDTFKDPRGRDVWYDRSPEAGDLGYTAHYYFSPRKFTNLDGPESALNSSSGVNYPVVRLADLYLLYAEAIQKTDPTKALEYINKVHRRAYGLDPNVASERDYKTLNDATMAAKNHPQDALANDPLKYERWAELFAEGQWWYDIRRWHLLENEMNVYQKTRYGKLVYQGERAYAQPIPQSEIEAYNGNLKQNYNY